LSGSNPRVVPPTPPIFVLADLPQRFPSRGIRRVRCRRAPPPVHRRFRDFAGALRRRRCSVVFSSICKRHQILQLAPLLRNHQLHAGMGHQRLGWCPHTGRRTEGRSRQTMGHRLGLSHVSVATGILIRQVTGRRSDSGRLLQPFDSVLVPDRSVFAASSRVVLSLVGPSNPSAGPMPSMRL